MEFRSRDYNAELEAHAIHRSRADHHPLATPSPSTSPQNQVTVTNVVENDFFDPLRGGHASIPVSNEETPDSGNTASVSPPSKAISEIPSKEWTSFKRFLMQKFPVSKMISVSSMPDVIIKTTKVDKSSKSTYIEEVDDSTKIPEDDVKVITQQEYVSRLYELKDEIMRAWHTEDRVTALKLCIKVAKLLMDTSVLQFYPTLFVLVTDVMDTLGDMVWQRIRQKAEFSEDENFKASDICSDAKETCNNWFCKVGSIRELLPRIYLELAILPCSRFLLEHPLDNLQRLVMMIRGIADPLASFYCRLYMAHCARKLSASDKGYLVTCVNDIKILLSHLLSEKEAPPGPFAGKMKLLLSLVEPTIEYIMKCVFTDVSQRQADSLFVDLGLGRNQANLSGSLSCASIVLHHMLKELPTDVISFNAVDILHLIKCANDSCFDQCLNYRLLGFRLGESKFERDTINPVVDEVIQVISQYDKLDDYLKVADAYMDIVLQNQMDNYLNMLLECLYTQACNKETVEDEQGNLQSIFLKLFSHFKDLDKVFSLKHFIDILDVMHGSSRNVLDMHILNMATRNGCINDPTTIKLLLEIAQSLHDGLDFANMKDDDRQKPAHLFSRFVQMVDFGVEVEQHLNFLVECRGVFGSVNELKETLIHSSNFLATKTLKDDKQHLNFVKSCIAFSEVTIPSISAQVRQLNLYLETAEVALLSGLIHHSDGLIVSAISCLENVDFTDGTRTATDVDSIVSSIRKLCSLLVIVPGNCDRGVTEVPSSILSLICSRSWMAPRITVRIFCAIILLLSTLSQNNLPYHLCNIPGNDLLFFGDSTYVNELILLSDTVLHNLLDAIDQEPSKAARGNMALEACNCIAISFKLNNDILQVCWKLIETARLCVSANNKYLLSTVKYLDEQLPDSKAVPSMAI